MASFRFVCELPTGLHARPASVLAETARRFHSAAVVTNEATGASAEARSVLSVIGLDVQRGHSVLVEASGDDAEKFIEEVRGLVAGKFGETEVGASEAIGAGFVARVPVPLRRAGVVMILGTSVCTGVGEGVVVWGGGAEFPKEYTGAAGGTVEEERARLAGAIDAVREEIEGALKKERPGAAKDILSAHRGIIIDSALASCMGKLIGSGMSAPGAVVAGAGQIAAKLEHSASAYIRERAADVREVCRRLLGVLDPAWGGGVEKPIVLEGPSVVVAKELGVGQLTSMDRRNLKGLVLGDVGRTSHLVILARSMQIPTLIGVEMSAANMPGGARAIVDAIGGFVVASPGAAAMEYYRREERARTRRGAKLAPLMARRGATRDGHAMEVAANAATAVEIAGAMEAGADSVGLLRTEMLFLDRATPPTEEEQYLLYRGAVEAADGSTALESRATKEVIIRTLDIGGDKPAPYITIAREENPFLGCRGVRLYKRELDLLRSQLRAICRASAHGTVKVMAPMVATVGEAKWFCERIARVQAELCEEGVAHDPNMAVGIMLEVPSAALVIDQLAQVVDFISIGTNDLCQYTFAADRTNAGVAELNNPREPAFLRLLDRIVSEAAAHGVWVGICGEMAGDVRHLPLMVGLGVAGLDEISVGAPSIGPVKAKLAGVSAAECREVLEKAMACETAEQVDVLLDAFASKGGSEMQGPLHSDLIVIDSDASTREHVIQELAGLLHAAGRTDDPRAVEEAAWEREEKGATGFGFGFCIPHAQTDAVACSSIAVARLRAPIEWPSMDGLPVGLAIMLTVRASDADQTHLKLLAKLARRLMHEGFRDALNNAASERAVLEVLEKELELGRAG